MMFMPRFRPSGGERSSGLPQTEREPVIGLALGGGAARGWAHIGVMRKLDAAGIRPRIVVGTSIGSVVGGSWAAGKLDDLEAFARGLTRRSVLGWMDFGLPGSGLMAGERLKRALEGHFKGRLIEELPIKFAAISTEIATGHEIWLTRGPLSDAMRASYALPGIFVPVQIAGRWLIDGALSNPVPVQVARALGAEMIIAVNLHTDVLGRSGVIREHGLEQTGLAAVPSPQQDEARQGLMAVVYGAANRIRRPFGGAGQGDAPSAPASVSEKGGVPPGILSVMLDAFNITQDRIARQRLAGDPPDVMVSPKIGGIGLSEFHRAAESIAAGEQAVERVLDDILDIRKALTTKG